jgi:hypothetical protein
MMFHSATRKPLVSCSVHKSEIKMELQQLFAIPVWRQVTNDSVCFQVAFAELVASLHAQSKTVNGHLQELYER